MVMLISPYTVNHSQSHVNNMSLFKELKAPRSNLHIARAFAISAIMSKALK